MRRGKAAGFRETGPLMFTQNSLFHKKFYAFAFFSLQPIGWKCYLSFRSPGAFWFRPLAQPGEFRENSLAQLDFTATISNGSEIISQDQVLEIVLFWHCALNR
jgi:hypothetical protein